MGLDEARVGGHAFQVGEDGIEPFDVADLQHAAVLLRELDQFGRLGSVIGHRLLDQHVPPLLEQRLGQVEVRRGGRNDVHGVTGCRASATEPKARTRYFWANRCAVSATVS